MYDAHYDLLTYIYMKYRQDDLDFIKDLCKKLYAANNITGGIVNLFFMSEQEMKNELNIDKEELDLIKMMSKVSEIADTYKLFPTKEILFGIEGMDYLNDVNDLDKLYSLGVRSFNIVWNEKNEYGSGYRSDIGLTEKGKDLIEKAIDLNMLIDLSHCNENTFWDIISIANEKKDIGITSNIFASHSNCKDVLEKQISKYDMDVSKEAISKNVFSNRNLTDKQLLAIKQLDGVVGLVEYKPLMCFTKSNDQVYQKKYRKQYIDSFYDQLYHLQTLFGDTNNIIIASDDMGYESHLDPMFYSNCNYFSYDETFKQNHIYFLKQSKLSNQEINKILKSNFESKILTKIE